MQSAIVTARVAGQPCPRADKPKARVVEGRFDYGGHTVTVRGKAFSCECQEWKVNGMCDHGFGVWFALRRARAI